jgi:hypothetical protein
MLQLAPKDRKGRLLTVGDVVIVCEIPASLLAGLPAEDQDAISAQKGQKLAIVDFDKSGAAELEFTDVKDVIHTIWIEPVFLEKSI